MKNLAYDYLTTIWTKLSIFVKDCAIRWKHPDFYAKNRTHYHKAQTAIDNASHAYYYITHRRAPVLITSGELHNIICMSNTYDELRCNINSFVGRDSIYCVQLFLSVCELYKSNEPPTLKGQPPLMLN